MWRASERASIAETDQQMTRCQNESQLAKQIHTCMNNVIARFPSFLCDCVKILQTNDSCDRIKRRFRENGVARPAACTRWAGDCVVCVIRGRAQTRRPTDASQAEQSSSMHATDTYNKPHRSVPSLTPTSHVGKKNLEVIALARNASTTCADVGNKQTYTCCIILIGGQKRLFISFHLVWCSGFVALDRNARRRESPS